MRVTKDNFTVHQLWEFNALVLKHECVEAYAVTGKESCVCYASGMKPSAEARDFFFSTIDFKLSVYMHSYKSKFSVQLTATAYTVTEV